MVWKVALDAEESVDGGSKCEEHPYMHSGAPSSAHESSPDGRQQSPQHHTLDQSNHHHFCVLSNQRNGLAGFNMLPPYECY